MASFVSKRPVIGVMAGLIFGALGLLLTEVENAPGGMKGFVAVMYHVVGYFLLFVAAMAILSALSGFWNGLCENKRNKA